MLVANCFWRRQAAAVDHVDDVVQVAMSMLGFVFDVHFGGSEPPAFDFVSHQATVCQPERGDSCLNRFQVHSRIDQGAQHHVATDTAEAIQIDRFHPVFLSLVPHFEVMP
jgi:hypothetical protein